MSLINLKLNGYLTYSFRLMRDKKKNDDKDWWIFTNDQIDSVLSVDLLEMIKNSEYWIMNYEVTTDDPKLKFRDKPEWICI